MTQDTIAQGLLILIAPVGLEEILIDLLLQKNELSGFTSSKVSRHGRHHAESNASLSMVEQVAGRQSRVQMMMYANFPVLEGLITELKQMFKHTGMHYILLPIAEAQSI